MPRPALAVTYLRHGQPPAAEQRARFMGGGVNPWPARKALAKKSQQLSLFQSGTGSPRGILQRDGAVFAARFARFDGVDR
jgi:hypothetical protein